MYIYIYIQLFQDRVPSKMGFPEPARACQALGILRPNLADKFGQIRPNSVKFGQNYVKWGKIVQICTKSSKIAQMWANLSKFEQNLGKFGQNCSNLDKIVQILAKLIKFGQNS